MFVSNLKSKQFVINVVPKVGEILDNCVTLPIANDGPTIVTSKTNATKWYFVYNLDCEWGCCDCVCALMGNICKHQIKVLMMLHPSLAEGTITCYRGSLASTNEGGRGSMLDHAVHFLDNCYDIGPAVPTSTPIHASANERATPYDENIEKHVRNLAA